MDGLVGHIGLLAARHVEQESRKKQEFVPALEMAYHSALVQILEKGFATQINAQVNERFDSFASIVQN